MSLEILVAIATIASSITALGTFFIYKKNSKPKLTLTILNNNPVMLVTNEKNYRNLYYVDDKQHNAMVHVEIENRSSVAGTLTDIFIRPKNSNKLSQAMAKHKDYNQEPSLFFVESKQSGERYNKKYQKLRQPITVAPYGYVIGFLYFPTFQFVKLEDKMKCVLEYRIAGINKLFEQELTLYRVETKLSKPRKLPSLRG